MQNIQMVDLQGLHQRLSDKIKPAIEQVIESGQFINGPDVAVFAKKLESFCNVKYVIPCANGTDALQIALMALGLNADDEVIIPVHTYVATAEVISLLKLKPVFVDVYPDTFNIDVDKIEALINNKTKAIIPVHLYGQCADIESILRLAQKHNLYVIEDAAQAIGAEYTFSDGSTKKAGAMGDIGCTSFFPSKNLGCMGDGGAIMTNNEALSKSIKMIANHGQSKKYQHDIVGCNSRLDTIQAAILNVKIVELEDFNNRRRKAAKYYNDKLKNIKGIITPEESQFSTHVFHQYTIKIKGGLRDKVKKLMEEDGVPSMIYYPIPLHKQEAYLMYSKVSYEVSDTLSEEVLSLPIHTELTHLTQDYILNSLIKSIVLAKE